ncbi:hypothetical protein N181_26425 [Sinorhizobium fredii USDA 205]|nr:hypothetical protein N181_26425 [Sinorhizobium fredii USDA 205]
MLASDVNKLLNMSPEVREALLIGQKQHDDETYSLSTKTSATARKYYCHGRMMTTLWGALALRSAAAYCMFP